MTTVSHEHRAERWAWLTIPGLTESIAITAMWVAVLFAAIFGPDFVSSSAGGDTTRIPSGLGVALFACIGSWAVAKHGLRHDR